MTLRRLCHVGPIIALSIIAALFIISILTIVSWLPPNNAFRIFHALLFHFWVLGILKNFFKASFIGPGCVPFKWKPAESNEQEYLQYCESCQGFKAPRAHHCKTCKRCVMKMDHHCPWINNCVGHYNHQSFTLFLFFVVIGCSHTTIMFSACVWDHLVWKNGYMLLKVYEDSMLEMRHWVLICLLFGIGLSVGVTVATSFLLYYQVKSIVKNETGIESWIVEKAMSRHRLSVDKFLYPYDLGFWKNVYQVMSWSFDYIGDGITWEVCDGCDQYTLTIEQLEQKDLKRDRMVTYSVIKTYSGTWFPCRLGCRVLFDCPWSEEGRVAVDVGDTFLVSRHRKHWVYGEKVTSKERNGDAIALGETIRVKGWVPRCCIEEQREDGITLLGQKKEQ